MGSNKSMRARIEIIVITAQINFCQEPRYLAILGGREGSRLTNARRIASQYLHHHILDRTGLANIAVNSEQKVVNGEQF